MIPSKRINLISRVTNKTVQSETRTCKRPLKCETQGGNGLCFYQPCLLGTISSDHRVDGLKKIPQAKLSGGVDDEDEGKAGFSNIITSRVKGIFLPWERSVQEGLVGKNITYDIFPSLTHEQENALQKSSDPQNQVVKNNLGEASSSSSCSLKPNLTSNVDRSSSSRSSSSSHHKFNIEVGSLKLAISWEDLTFGELIGRGCRYKGVFRN